MFEDLKMSATWVNVDYDGYRGGGDVWRCTLSRNGARMQVRFTQGSAYRSAPPTVEDVVDALCSDARAGGEDFDEFCDNFGYDEDSREAYKTWKACQSISERLPRILTNDEYRAVSEGDEVAMYALKLIKTKNN